MLVIALIVVAAAALLVGWVADVPMLLPASGLFATLALALVVGDAVAQRRHVVRTPDDGLDGDATDAAAEVGARSTTDSMAKTVEPGGAEASSSLGAVDPDGAAEGSSSGGDVLGAMGGVPTAPSARDTSTAVTPPGPSGRPPSERLVGVVPGRRRFHHLTCALIEGRSPDELTLEEARDEGFTPCTRCADSLGAPGAEGRPGA